MSVVKKRRVFDQLWQLISVAFISAAFCALNHKYRHINDANSKGHHNTAFLNLLFAHTIWYGFVLQFLLYFIDVVEIVLVNFRLVDRYWPSEAQMTVIGETALRAASSKPQMTIVRERRGLSSLSKPKACMTWKGIPFHGPRNAIYINTVTVISRLRQNLASRLDTGFSRIYGPFSKIFRGGLTDIHRKTNHRDNHQKHEQKKFARNIHLESEEFWSWTNTNLRVRNFRTCNFHPSLTELGFSIPEGSLYIPAEQVRPYFPARVHDVRKLVVAVS